MADMNDYCDNCGEYHYMGAACRRPPRSDLVARQRAEERQAQELTDARERIRTLEAELADARKGAIEILAKDLAPQLQEQLTQVTTDLTALQDTLFSISKQEGLDDIMDKVSTATLAVGKLLSKMRR